MDLSPAWLQAYAAIFTLVAALAAVWATFHAPRLAASFAESLRSQSARLEQSRAFKLLIFTNLMQFRRQISNPTAIGSLNVIDVAFTDSSLVRQAWRSFYDATLEKPHSNEKIIERYLAIVVEMARDLGLSQTITVQDIQTSYYPSGLGQVDEAAWLEVQDKLQRLKLGIEN